LTTPSLPRSDTLRRSFSSRRIGACSISAAVGAGLRCISPKFAVRASPASHYRNDSSRLHARAAEKGLSDKIGFRLQDYRDVPEKFDRIVSVGMFEHVGVGFYDAFFGKCSSYAVRSHHKLSKAHQYPA
jgi:cyclopropane fatty-acyl-phospholipid synthase-like methyltransferase